MECDICTRLLTTRRQALCVSCTQAKLHHSRLEQVTALLDREKTHSHLEAILRPGNDGVLAALPQDADWDAITAGVNTNRVCDTRAYVAQAEQRILEITEKAEALRRQIEEYREHAAQERKRLDKRRKELALEEKELDHCRATLVHPVESAVKKTKQRLAKIRDRTTVARRFLCEEITFLSDFRVHRKRDNSKVEYHINGLPIPDLRDFHGPDANLKIESIATVSGPKPLYQAHDVISASFDNVCRFLGVCCHYLSIALPAEIVLPHADFPHALILPKDSAYRRTALRFPGITSSQPLGLTSNRSGEKASPSRPRVLHLDRPPVQLMKDDPKTYAFFLEGVSLLAYDIAWLCRSQGVSLSNDFEDICAIGRNLSLLLSSIPSKHHRQTQNRKAADQAGQQEHGDLISDLGFGAYSHASAHHSLCGHEGHKRFESWKLSPKRFADQLASFLRHETQGAEWHYVDDVELNDEREDEKPVLVGGMRRMDKKGLAMSVMTLASHGSMEDLKQGPGKVNRGTNGWTKIRGRNEEE